MYLYVWVYVCIMGVCMYVKLRIPIRPGMGNHSQAKEVYCSLVMFEEKII